MHSPRKIQTLTLGTMRSVLFHRDFRGFSGGHLKVWHYFNHVRHSPDHIPEIYFSEQTIWDESNPWLSFKDQALPSWGAIRPDVRVQRTACRIALQLG